MHATLVQLDLLQPLLHLVTVQTNATPKCLVCCHPSSSAHFGSYSCLACAAFFRRTVALDITFQCKGNRNCTIFHELRMICRACRYDKCIKAGMKREAVQKRRPPRKGIVKTPSQDVSSMGIEHHKLLVKEEIGEMDDFELIQNQNISNPSSSGSQIDERKLSVEPLAQPTCLTNPLPHQILDQFDASIPSTSSSFTNYNSPPDPSTLGPIDFPSSSQIRYLNMTGTELLNHYVEELKSSMDKRRIFFTRDPLRSIISPCGSIPYKFEECIKKSHTMRAQNESQRFDHLLAYEYCKNIPGYDQLGPHEKVMFYKMGCLAYGVLDVTWLSASITDLDSSYMIYTDGSASTVDDLSLGWDNEPPFIDQETKAKHFWSFIKRMHSAIVRPLQVNKVDVVEFAALKALCVWKLGYVEFTPKIKNLAKEHEAALLMGLNDYYDLQNRQDKAERFGNIILMMGSVFEVYQEVLEVYKRCDLFDLFEFDTVSRLLL